jgi:hypothetical protein
VVAPFLLGLQTVAVLFSNSFAVLTDRNVVRDLMHQLQRVCLSFQHHATNSQPTQRMLTAWLDQMVNLGHETCRVHSIDLPPRRTGRTDAVVLGCYHHSSVTVDLFQYN